MAALRSAIAAAGDTTAQGAALCAGLAAFVGPGSELEKTILEAFKLSTETVHPDAESDAGEACGWRAAYSKAGSRPQSAALTAARARGWPPRADRA